MKLVIIIIMKQKSLEVFITGPAGRLEAKYFREANQKLLEELHIRATTCPLTGIFNRKVVFDHGENAFLERNSGEGKDFSLLSVDIDFFKKVNDTYGHPGGDEVIIALAKLLEKKGKPNIVGRVGGEEFMAIIMHDEDLSIEDFCSSLKEEVNNLEIPFQDTITVSYTHLTLPTNREV